MGAHGGSGGKFAVGDANPIVGGSAGRLLHILGGHSFGAVKGIINGNGTVGSCSQWANRVRSGPINVGGAFSINPTFGDMFYFLPKMLGTANAGGTFALSDVALPFVVQTQTAPGGGFDFTYPTNYVDEWTLSGNADEAVTLTISALGLTESGPGSDFPALTPPSDTDLIVFSDLTLTLGGTEVKAKSFSITGRNMLVPQRTNSRTATGVSKTGREIFLAHVLPEADVDVSDFTDAEVAAVLNLSYNGQSLIMTMPAVRYSPETPKFAGRGQENDYPLNGQAFRTGASLELVTTCDQTPTS